jgi:hypothetical protein
MVDRAVPTDVPHGELADVEDDVAVHDDTRRPIERTRTGPNDPVVGRGRALSAEPVKSGPEAIAAYGSAVVRLVGALWAA